MIQKKIKGLKTLYVFLLCTIPVAFLIYELILLFKIGSWAPIIHALMLCIVLIVLQAMALSKSRKLESS